MLVGGRGSMDIATSTGKMEEREGIDHNYLFQCQCIFKFVYSVLQTGRELLSRNTFLVFPSVEYVFRGWGFLPPDKNEAFQMVFPLLNFDPLD